MTTRLSLVCLFVASPVLSGEIRGRVLMGDRPAKGVTVSAVPYETPFEGARREARNGALPAALATVKTAADGTFGLSVTATTPFRLLLQGPGVVAALTADVYDGAEAEDVGDLPLAKAARLAGRVVSAAGKPLAGAEVRLSPGRGRLEDAADLLAWPRTATSRPDGTFQFDDAAETANRLAVNAPGFAPEEASGLRAGAVSRPLVVTAVPAFSGVVRKADGRTPAAGAVVRFEGKATSRWVEAAADGSFRLALPSGSGKLVADGGDGTLGELGLPLASGRTATLVLKPAAALTGRVVDAKTARPVPRVKVAARAAGEAIVGRSGPDGRYRLQGLLPRRYRLEADEPRYVPHAKDDVLVKAGETRTVDLPITLGASISGRVVDENGAPIVGARGRLARPGETGIGALLREMRAGHQRFAFRTGADGSFKASRLVPGDNQRLTVSHDEYEKRTLGGIALPAGAVKANLRIVLRRGIELAGVILDEARSPISGADVELSQSRLFRTTRGAMQMVVGGAPERRPKVSTGPDGRFGFRGLSAGEYALAVRKPGFADANLDPLKVGAEKTEAVEVTLTPGATISGRVVRPGGQGAEGFAVAARPRGQAREGPLGPRAGNDPTGPDGAFTLEGLKPGETYELQVLGPTGLGPRKEVEAPAEGVEIAVTGTGRIVGRALDARTGTPIVNFEPSWGPALSGGPGGGMVFRMTMRGPGRRGGLGDKAPVHSEDGSFALDDVPAGTWAVSVEADGYQAGRVGGVVVEAGMPREGVEVRLSPAAGLSGRVTDARSGQPVLDSAVSAEPTGGTPGPRMTLGLGEADATTDADGNFQIRGLGAGKYKLTAKHPDFSDGSEIVEVKDGPATVDIRLAAGGALAGIVLSEAQRPLPGADVTLAAAGEGGFGRFGPGGDQATLTDDAGRFRFDHLAAGRYTVGAALRGRSAPSAEVVLQGGESRDGVTLRLEAGATLRGAVTGLPEAQRNGVNLSARGAADYFASARTGADGLFELAGVPPGPVDLRGTAGDFLSSTRTAATQVVVPQGVAEVTADLVFESGFTISGRVTRAGVAMADAFVNASLQGGGGLAASARSDASGGFALEGLRTGTYNVFASLPEGGSSRRETVKLEGDATVDLDFPSARLAGTVVEAGTRDALPDAVVEVSSREIGFFRMATTDSNGRFSLEDLEPKAYPMTVRRAGYRLEQRTVTAADQGSDNLVFELSRGEGIGLRVRDGVFGVPLRGLLARALDASGAPVFTGSVSLDDEGRGEIPSLRPDRYTLVLAASGYASRTLEGVAVPAPTQNVTLTPGGALELLASPEVLAGGPIRCRILMESGGTYFPNPLSPAGELIVSTPVRRLDNVSPGRYTLIVEGKQPKPFAIEEGGTTRLELR